jgi:hypothetical protein
VTITTLDGALAGMQMPVLWAKSSSPTMLGPPWWQSFWYLGGFPSSGAAPATTANGTPLTSSTSLVQGQLYRSNPGSSATGNYIGRFSGCSSVAGTLILADRLLQCGGITTGAAIAVTTTTAQTINTTTLPARDKTGTTNGVGVLGAVEISAATGAAAPVLTLGYTNSTGTASRSGTNLIPTINSTPTGGFYPIILQAGDVGMQSVQTITIGTSLVSGSVCVVLYRPLVALELPGAYIPNAIDALTAGFPQLFYGAVPFFIWVASATTGVYVSGSYVETQG